MSGNQRIFYDPVSEYNCRVNNRIDNFDFETRRGFKNNIMVRPQSYGRMALHVPTNTLLVFASRVEKNLRGNLLPNGHEQATTDGIEAGYLISAFRSKGKSDAALINRPDFRTNAGKTYRSLRRYCINLQKNVQTQYSLLGFTHGNTTYLTNRDVIYTISPQGARQKISLHVPISRHGEDHHLNKIKGNNSFIWGYGAVSKGIGLVDTHSEAREVAHQHWEVLSSAIWDQEKDAKYQGFGFQKWRAETINATIDHSFATLVASGVFGGVGYALNTNLGLVAAGVGAFAYAAGHVVLNHGVSERLTQKYEGHQAKRERYNLESYEYGEDALDYFLAEKEIGKLAPKLDLSRIDPMDIEFLTAEETGWMRYDELGILSSALSDDTLAKFLIRSKMMGLSSDATMPDMNTFLNIYQNGLVHLMQNRDDGKVIVYAQDRPDVCRMKRKRLPEEFREKLGDKITRVEYDPDTKDFGRDTIAYKDMVGETTENLFRSYPVLPDEGTQRKSAANISDSFYDNTKKRENITKNPPTLPPLEAIIPEPE